MGLFYTMPISKTEGDRVELPAQDQGPIVLKSYGPPMIFWGYLAAVLIVIGVMFALIKGPALKLAASPDFFNQLIAYGVLVFIVALPIFLLAIFFYEKQIRKNQEHLHLTHLVFYLPLWTKKISLQSATSFSVEHFMDTPNMARKYGKENLRAFFNQGHFNLFALDKMQKKIFVDRSSRKPDLEKMAKLLSEY